MKHQFSRLPFGIWNASDSNLTVISPNSRSHLLFQELGVAAVNYSPLSLEPSVVPAAPGFAFEMATQTVA